MSPPLTDLEERAIHTLRHGDRVDRASFFDRHRAELQQMARARLDPRIRRRLDDSDVIQEVFVRYCGEMETYLRDPQIPPLVWLRRIVRQTIYRLHRDHMETQCRDLRREVSEATTGNFALDHLSESFSSVAKGLKRQELRTKLKDIFSRMSETDREILALVHIEDRTVREAAMELDIEMEAAKKRYHRALVKLREMNQSSLQEFLG